MTTIETPVKPAHLSPAVLKNVTATMVMMRALMQRPPGLPGLGVLFGPSGYGKSMAAQFCQGRLNAVYLEAADFWSRKTFCQILLMELGTPRPKGTVADLMAQILSIMGEDPDRPLIIDEADKIVDKGAIELVRHIQDVTQVPILLVGEEILPQKLQAYERVHGRVLEWLPAELCDQEDTRSLADLVCPKLQLADDLISLIRERTRGRARRIVNTLHQVNSFAVNCGIQALDASNYAGRFDTGETPRRAGRVE